MSRGSKQALTLTRHHRKLAASARLMIRFTAHTLIAEPNTHAVTTIVNTGRFMNEAPSGLKAKHNQAAALVAELTLDEKAQLCSGKNFWHLEGVERLNLPEIMVTDGPHGLRKQVNSADHVGLNKSVPATCFPTACALAASWDIQLIEQIGIALGQECAAQQVAVLLGPGLNIKRHPLCGRNFEYFSEDPLLGGKLAAAMVKGVQSQGVGTSVKHFAVNNQEQGRMFIDAIVDERTLREIYLRGFEIAVKEAQPWTVMCAYNRVNGEYCSEHTDLLTHILRDEWGFNGLVVTDWGATNDRVKGVLSGLDLEMPASGGVNDALVATAVRNGQLEETALDQIIQRNVALSLMGADLAAEAHAVDLQANHELAHRAALETAVLLKNESSLLPLAQGTHIAVIGAFAKSPRYQGTGSSQVNPTQLDNAWDGLTQMSDRITYAPGYDPKHSVIDEDLVAEAVEAARSAAVAVVFVGLPNLYESEGFDRNNMALPEQHDRLVQAVAEANPATVVVLSNGAPVALPWINEVSAVLETYLPGQAGGAVAELLFGLANPSGKLAETFAVQQTDVPSDKHFPGQLRQVAYREGIYVGYRYFDSAGTPVQFPFGHGLSYTQFSYGTPTLSDSTLGENSHIELTVPITNIGNLPGAEVVQLYVHAKHSAVYRPMQELKGFTKLTLDPGETRMAHFRVDNDSIKFFDQGYRKWLVEGGEYELRIAASSRDIRQIIDLKVDSEQTPSAVAAAISGPNLSAIESTDDERFAAMLNRPVPPPEHSRPFHENSSVAEIAQTWLGARVKTRLVAGFQQNMGGQSSNETLNKMFEEMANNLPLRGLVIFSRGKVSMQHIRWLLALLNHQYLRAIKLGWQVLRHQRSQQ